MRDDAVLGRALPLDRGLGPTQAGDMATVCWTIHSRHNPPDLPRLETWPQCAGPYTPGLAFSQKRIRVTKVTNVTARPLLQC